ncbi:Spy/CpxP family protein refolding chaperone [Pseudomonadota bacterium]
MNNNHFRFYVVSIPLLFLSISSASVTQASDNYPMMGRGEHRSMMGYGYSQGRYTENIEGRDTMSYGRRGMDGMGCNQISSGMMGYGHMGSGMRGGLQAIMQLDLSDAQKQKVREIHRQHRRENWNRMGEMMEHQDKLEELYDVDIPDPKAIGEVYAAIFEIQRKKIESTIQTQNKMRTLLTSKQQEALDEELKNTRHYRRGYGRMH